MLAARLPSRRLICGGWLTSAPDEIGLAALVIGLPVRVAQMLVFRDRFKLATVQVDADGQAGERILEVTPVAGEQAARTSARDLVAALAG